MSPDLIGWILRHWEPAQAARCTACGKRAGGTVVDSEINSIECEHCGKSWGNMYDRI